MTPPQYQTLFFYSSVSVIECLLKPKLVKVRQNVASLSVQALHNANTQHSVQREQTDKMFTHRQTADTGTQKAEGKR